VNDFDRQLEAPPAEQWKHEPNPLVGTLIHRYEFDGGQYEPADMLVIQPEGSEVAFSVLCGKATLRSFVEEKNPRVGGKVGLKYRGERTSAAGNTYADYAAAYEPPPEQQQEKTRDVEEGGEKEDSIPF
jgi:hypothetical protein